MIWGKSGKGCVRRVTDEDIQNLVIEIKAKHFCTAYISLPRDPRTVIGIRLPYLTLVVKYLKLPFCFEFEMMDSSNMKRRFRASNCQTSTTINPLLCHMPLALDDGWNKIQIDLPAFTRQAYNTDFVEFLAIHIYANCRIRRVYFSDRWYSEEELPAEYRMWKPSKKTKSRLAKV
ncbi:cilia- and flagella-associated protein 20-like [Uloborus diversus]|uniref:cilia- and flagella-associated protein 20-like n=1 Tax=Uloborus diversus TaxID=327109 RepID=UPI002409C0C5|nr:cilia- and flagella-associated protein 20-like [Uloborus diversus]